MRVFKSANTAVIEQCRYVFRIELSSVQLQRRFDKFLVNAVNNDNVGWHDHVIKGGGASRGRNVVQPSSSIGSNRSSV